MLEDWPISYDDLEPHYQRVEDFLDVQQLPFAEPGFALAKTAAMQHASGGRGFALAPLAVRFRDGAGQAVVGAELPPAAHPNIHGSWRRTCRRIDPRPVRGEEPGAARRRALSSR